jgi:hypothetical protein
LLRSGANSLPLPFELLQDVGLQIDAAATVGDLEQREQLAWCARVRLAGENSERA